MRRVNKMDNEPLSKVDRYGEVDGPLPILPNANFMPHWFFPVRFFLILKKIVKTLAA